MIIEQIADDTLAFQKNLEHLKRNSDYWPQIFTHEQQKQSPHGLIKEVSFSTLVRIEREGKWYTVHCVESCDNIEPLTREATLKRMAVSVHNIQNLYVVGMMMPQTSKTIEDVDSLQINEEERLRILFEQRR